MGKPKFPTLAHALANAKLLELRRADDRLKAMKAAIAAEVEVIHQAWLGKLNPLLEEIIRLNRDIQDLEREHQADFFGDLKSARMQLPAGALLYELTHPVIRAKGRRAKEVLAEIEEYALLEMYGLGGYDGFLKVLKIAKSLNFDDIEEWPDARLTMVGLDRKTVETFGYELKEAES